MSPPEGKPKLAVVLRTNLLPWQAVNVTAFTVSGIAGTQDVLGDPYEDASGVRYLPMIAIPIVVFQDEPEHLPEILRRALREERVVLSLFTEELFSTPHDVANRAAVRAVPTEELRLAGLALYGARKPMERVLRGLTLHR